MPTCAPPSEGWARCWRAAAFRAPGRAIIRVVEERHVEHAASLVLQHGLDRQFLRLAARFRGKRFQRHLGRRLVVEIAVHAEHVLPVLQRHAREHGFGGSLLVDEPFAQRRIAQRRCAPRAAGLRSPGRPSISRRIHREVETEQYADRPARDLRADVQARRIGFAHALEQGATCPVPVSLQQRKDSGRPDFPPAGASARIPLPGR